LIQEIIIYGLVGLILLGSGLSLMFFGGKIPYREREEKFEEING